MSAETVKRTSGIVEAAAGPLYYEEAGQGPAIVLIHAGVTDHRLWDEQMDALAQHHRVVRYDTRGFGKTPAAENDYSETQDVLDLMDHVGIERACLIGVSRGGGIATDFVLEHPERVYALVVVNAGLGGYRAVATRFPSEEMIKMWDEEEEAEQREDWGRALEIDLRMWTDGPGRTPDQVDPTFRARAAQINPSSNPVPRGQGQPIELDPPAATRLHEIKVPTLVIIGDQDWPLVLDTMDYVAEHIEGARKVTMHGTAHLSPLEKPEEFNRIVLEFLGSL